MSAPTKLLVLGAEGLLGSAVVDAARTATLLAAAPARADLDLTDTSAVLRAVDACGATHVVIAAARPHVEGCEADPAGTRRVNLDAPAALAAPCAARGVSLVAFSTEYVFPGRELPYAEDDTPDPINEYGRQKLALERALGGHLVLRTSGLYGPEAKRKNFVLSLWDKAAKGERMRVPNDQLITPTFTPSLAALVVAACQQRLTGVLHMAGPQVLARDRFTAMALTARGFDGGMFDAVTTSSLGLRAPRPRAGLDVARAQGLLGALRAAFTPPSAGLQALAALEAA